MNTIIPALPHPTSVAQTTAHLPKARFFGTMCMIAGVLFSFSFLALNPMLQAFQGTLTDDSSRLIRCIVWCATSVCLAGAPLGLITLHSGSSRLRRVPALAGVTLSLLGLVLYIVGSIYIYNAPDRAFRQLFTPGGSVLLTVGTLVLSFAIRGSKRLRGWRGYTPLAAGLYFPVQFPFQAIFFLGAGKGPMVLLLGVWGVFWFLLGYAIWSSTSLPTQSNLD
ncbi:MAG: hypothetical protein H7039_23905 [Bryobacteraceae bacterium]|nr:hypothetical protein [Bryobacteraceae bacterium]